MRFQSLKCCASLLVLTAVGLYKFLSWKPMVIIDDLP